MERRVTLKTIAECVGVHVSTVSLALRDHHRISVEMRKKIQDLAVEMGYRPDPSMRALCAYRHAVQPREVQSGLAYLTNFDSSVPYQRLVRDNARRRAEELGYNLIEYNLLKQDISLERLKSIWWSQGLRGIIVGPFRNQTKLELTLDQWPVVAVGHSVQEPNFNRVTTHHLQNMLTHLEELHSRGYRRVGLCLPTNLDERTGGQIHAAYLLDSKMAGLESPPPVFSKWPALDGIAEWIQQHRIEAVIGHVDHYKALLALGFVIPKQIGFSVLTISRDQQEWADLAGFDEMTEELSANMVDFLVSLIHEQAKGVLNPQRFFLVSGNFRDGTSLRPKC
ncbi:LacI family DNA-binding transcriptional regulator [Coraliomargarita algicola]|uniref:LacI family DNA-binding transcriptional regulator n=1 Tax=Coraliomargarita algicola TaxID=3092156 RepID=A0ABZ0RG22_9BACT|nr:LacI family DNA-binding transcriptional regulator [Coraliomargarita sp. J2-16]WPJ94161.1 LacI family DNA-binding transcriptional regulator [Coraliomargarita sp. J2-16]